MNMPPQVVAILNKLNNRGYEAYVVGGCVRDELLGLEPHDWDVTTSAFPDEIQRCLSDFKIIETGIEHGTVTAFIDKLPVEITTFRVDGTYSDNRHPDKVQFTRDITEDLARRDFTINAIAYHPEAGIIDCFHGVSDINHRIIRCVGNPSLRFEEDGLRILRALRFASVLGFTIDSETSRSLIQKRGLLNQIAFERIREEFIKLICGKNTESILQSYYEVIEVFIPEIHTLYYDEPGIWKHTLKCMTATEATPVLRMTMLLHDFNDKGGEIAQRILKRLRFDNKTVNKISRLIQYYDVPISSNEVSIKHFLNEMGLEDFKLLLNIKRAIALAGSSDNRSEIDKLKKIDSVICDIIESNSCFSLDGLAITGNDLIAAGMPKGPEIGSLLKILLNDVIENQCANSYSALLNRLKDRKAGLKNEACRTHHKPGL